MRKIFLIITLISFNILSTFSQQKQFDSRLFVGGGGGVSLSTIDFNPRISQQYKLGFNGGATVRYIAEKYVGLQLEVNFAQRGWTEKFDKNPGFSYTRNLTYVDVPFLTHVYYGSKTKFIFNIGPQVSFLVGESGKISPDLQSYVDKQRQDIPDKPFATQYDKIDHRFDYGLTAGIGVELETKAGTFDLEGRYYFGLGDIFKNSVENQYSRSAQRVASVKLSYLIPLF